MMNFDDLTLEELEEMELLLNSSIDEAFSDGKPKGRALRVLYFVVKRKQDPSFKFEDTAKVTQKEAAALLSGNTAKKE